MPRRKAVICLSHAGDLFRLSGADSSLGEATSVFVGDALWFLQ
jgi:hypothetical protein